MTPLLPRDLWSRTTRVEVALHVQCLAAAIDRVQSAVRVPPTCLSDLTAEFELADHPLTIKLFDDPEIADTSPMWASTSTCTLAPSADNSKPRGWSATATATTSGSKPLTTFRGCSSATPNTPTRRGDRSGRPRTDDRTAPRTPAGRREPVAPVRRHLQHGDDRTLPRVELHPVRLERQDRKLPPDPRRTIRKATAPSTRPRRRQEHRHPADRPLRLRAQCRPIPDGQGFFKHLAGDQAVARSGGSEPGSEVNPAAVEAMAEVGIDISQEFPKPWTDEAVRQPTSSSPWAAATPVRSSPASGTRTGSSTTPPAKTSTPSGPISDEIEKRVRNLLDELDVQTV